MQIRFLCHHDVTIREEEDDCTVYVLIEAQRATYIVQEETPKPYILLGYYHYTLNTPSQIQRECNDVAFGELILSTRLKRNKKKIHPSLKS